MGKAFHEFGVEETGFGLAGKWDSNLEIANEEKPARWECLGRGWY